MPGEHWIRFEGYEGRLDPGYRGAYASAGFRYPYVDRTRSWDIVRVEGEPTAGVYRRDEYVVLSRGHDMMKKAHEEAAAYRLHFMRCGGVGVCADIGHPGGPRRSHREALPQVDGVSDGGPATPEPQAPMPGAVVKVDGGSEPASSPHIPDWVQALKPAGSIVERTVTPDLRLQVIPLRFRLWEGPLLGMAEDCNKRGGRVVGEQDDLSCAEVEIVRRLRANGWDAAWFQAWKCGRRRWGEYISDQIGLPPVVQRIQRDAGAAGGHPDVIAWHGDRVLAIESKSPTDRLKGSQIGWFKRARLAGIAPADTALVEWRVVSPA